ncbi:MAG TPA: hydroxymethylpyrimidine/phosphomethylpyrimidine kinase [Planctomycetes bacterium]|nr:hydroxymethylpyrimidine/phosphomethylpyrimidine kinase [Planctomycetota bacterium]HIK59631.1 hydroxymethylpyrimidine/phosphomethylpyrimidine kinase [Planctomycetota bacterium]
MSADATLLCIGGVDSSGAAGLDADREAAESAGVKPTLVPTAHTEQDEQAVHALGARKPAEWLAEARAALPYCDGVKIGLLPGPEHILAAGELLGDLGDRHWVLDPVIESSSGFRFLNTRALWLLREELLPLGPVLTPNLNEAALLAGVELIALGSRNKRVAAARNLVSGGAESVVLKGGHGGEVPLVDLVARAGHEPFWIERERIEGSRRGTGCRFATVLAAHMAQGVGVTQAAERAGAWVASYVARGAGA